MKYRVYYKNDNCPDEKWEYIITAVSAKSAKWEGLLRAEEDGHWADWIDVYCEKIEDEE